MVNDTNATSRRRWCESCLGARKRSEIIARDAPNKEEDPDFDPDDAMIVYVGDGQPSVGEIAPKALHDKLAKELGLDQPIPIQYLIWIKEAVGRIAVRGLTKRRPTRAK